MFECSGENRSLVGLGREENWEVRFWSFIVLESREIRLFLKGNRGYGRISFFKVDNSIFVLTGVMNWRSRNLLWSREESVVFRILFFWVGDRI